jgi:hypothetical protein
MLQVQRSEKVLISYCLYERTITTEGRHKRQYSIVEADKDDWGWMKSNEEVEEEVKTERAQIMKTSNIDEDNYRKGKDECKTGEN